MDSGCSDRPADGRLRRVDPGFSRRTGYRPAEYILRHTNTPSGPATQASCVAVALTPSDRPSNQGTTWCASARSCSRASQGSSPHGRALGRLHTWTCHTSSHSGHGRTSPLERLNHSWLGEASLILGSTCLSTSLSPPGTGTSRNRNQCSTCSTALPGCRRASGARVSSSSM